MFTFTFLTSTQITVLHGSTPPRKMKISSSLLAIQPKATQVHLEQWLEVRCEQSDDNQPQIFTIQQQIPEAAEKVKGARKDYKEMAALG